MGSVQVFVSPKLGATCVPGGSSPPVLIVGEALAAHERLAGFLILRAMKLVKAHASALVRTPPAELAVLVAAWLKCFNPTWQPQGVPAASVNAMGGKVQAALPRNLGPDVGVVALEVAAALGTQAPTLGMNALFWGNRVSLLALGDATSAARRHRRGGRAAGRLPAGCQGACHLDRPHRRGARRHRLRGGRGLCGDALQGRNRSVNDGRADVELASTLRNGRAKAK